METHHKGARMQGDTMRPNITLTVDDGSIDTAVVEEAVRNALEECYPLGCISVCSTSQSNGKRTVAFRVGLDGTDRVEGADISLAATDRIDAHCDLLDGMGVANGTKAIAIALHARWTDLHRARFGEAANPATVKRWRTARRSGSRTAGSRSAAWGRRSSGPARVVRGIRLHHAIRVSGGGGTVRDGYEQAMQELRVVNAGGSRFYGRPDRPLPPFSYETFCRDCRSIRRGSATRRRKRERVTRRYRSDR